MTHIREVAAREIVDSRGNPTLAVSVRLEDGATGWAGVPARGERVAKYNRLLEIERELGPTAGYAGLAVLGRAA